MTVVGAGPAGAAAAITLARAGRSVLLADKATFPRDKCCGDGLTTGALRILDELGLDPKNVPSWQIVDDVVVRSPSGYSPIFPLPRHAGTYAAVARRTELDAAVVDVARDAGVEVRAGHGCRGVEPASDGVTVGLDGAGPVTTRYVIAADGMWSPVRKYVGADQAGYRGEWHAFRQYFTGVGPRAAKELFVWFEPDLLPGYAWSFPLPDNRANVGFGVVRGARLDGGAIKHQWADVLSRPHIAEVLGPRAQPEAPHKAWPIPARVDDTTLTKGRVLFVGDAARASDPLTGEGIGQALVSGIAAADAIVESGPLDWVGASRRYREAVRRNLVADHRMALVLSRALRHRKGARGTMRLAGATDWTRRNFARWLFEDYPRAVIATPSRWHAGMFTGPGAFRDRNGSSAPGA